VRKGGALIEVATFRGAADADDGNGDAKGRILRDNVFGTVEEDAVRRDFTINALFLDPVSGEIRDYVGGYQDLADRVLRLIGDPALRYREDPVRLLRAARFVAKLGVEPEEETSRKIPELAHLLRDVPSARLFEEICKLFLTGHGLRSMEALQRFGLSTTLFPGLENGSGPGKVLAGPVLWKTLENTDERVRDSKPVTPAFLFAALLWQPVRDRFEELVSAGDAEFVAMMKAAEEAIAGQSRQTAIPRRFSAVTRQIWVMQIRFKRTRGKRWKRLLHEDKFRAGYDFLKLRQVEDPDLETLVSFWTEAQAEAGIEPTADNVRKSRGRSRQGRYHRRRARPAG
jgi:poly(A) polymerase